jgi:V8-like Glu-specific endopeptidase
MCQCKECSNKEMELLPEFESIFQDFNNKTYEAESFEVSHGSHPTLGPGRRILKQRESQAFETGYTGFHPALGKGRIINQDNELNTEYEIIGADNRHRVASGKDTPYRWICHLDLQFPDPDVAGGLIGFGGSGLLISPRHILTAGHCLFDKITGSNNKNSASVQVSKIFVTPGSNGGASGSFGTYTATKVQFTSPWKASFNYKFDFGLITLDENIGSKQMASLGGKVLGYWGDPVNGSNTRIKAKSSAELTGNSVNISGYPGDKKWGTQWRAFGKIVNISPAAGAELVYYDLDTCGGHSGGPVWQLWEQYRNLIAIHTGPCIPIRGNSDCIAVTGKPCFPGGQRFSSNRGVRITDILLNQVREWIKN